MIIPGTFYEMNDYSRYVLWDERLFQVFYIRWTIIPYTPVVKEWEIRPGPIIQVIISNDVFTGTSTHVWKVYFSGLWETVDDDFSRCQ